MLFSKKWMTGSTKEWDESLRTMQEWIDEADAVMIGAGAGLSAACGPEFAYSGERFERIFGDFAEKYGIADEYSGGFYPYGSQEEFWAWWSRAIWHERYLAPAGEAYRNLLRLVQGKDYFVLTTNVDHQFQKAGFAKERLFYTPGDYGLFQCSVPCHKKTYDNYEIVKLMVETQQDMRIPSELVPKCPVCGEPMSMNLRCDDTFVEDAGWHAAAERYGRWMREHEGQKILFLEIGVGGNTPSIIKFPFWREVQAHRSCRYIQLNKGEVLAPAAMRGRALLVDGDAGLALRELAGTAVAEQRGAR